MHLEYDASLSFEQRMESMTIASNLLESLGQFQNSQERLNQVRYNHAIQLLTHQPPNFIDAKTLLSKLPSNYRNTEGLLSIFENYTNALLYFNKAAYEIALNELLIVERYLDISELLDRVRYNIFVTQLVNNDYFNAIITLGELSPHSESALNALEKFFVISSDLYQSEQYEDVVNLLQQLMLFDVFNVANNKSEIINLYNKAYNGHLRVQEELIVAMEALYAIAINQFYDGRYEESKAVFILLDNFNDSKIYLSRIRFIMKQLEHANLFSAGNNHSVYVQYDGSVVAYAHDERGEIAFNQNDINAWYDIVSVAAGGTMTIGLKRNGTVVLTGHLYGSPVDDGVLCDAEWSNIIAIAAGDMFVVGLRVDGTVVSFGHDASDGQRDVEDWTNIIAIATGVRHTVGLRSDGYVNITGFRGEAQMEAINRIVDINNPIHAISAGGGHDGFQGYGHTVVLFYDGTVYAAGDNFFSQADVETWHGIVEIVAGAWHTVGLRYDGTVVTTFPTRPEALERFNNLNDDLLNVHNWSGIVSIAAGTGFTIGLDGDGYYLTHGFGVVRRRAFLMRMQ
jgi:hypothetical protein